ncbi:glucose PTS transporter subunit IIA [Butyricicoccus sp.]|uniref:glucose PTS transporter subunit IIA n=1 Tax=Butyricicoccus sp. TaxID=2049021 RepID=UPI003F16DB66
MGRNSVLVAPVTGRCVDLSTVPDEMFSTRAMGDGVAFVYDGDTIVAPCNGEISVVAETNHAVGLTTDDGMELLIHIGVDTVALKGKGFQALVKTGDKVKVGTPLLKVDRKFLDDQGINLITSMVVTNEDELAENKIGQVDRDVVAGKTSVIEYAGTQQPEITKNAGKKTKYQDLCETIIANVGGKSNVIGVTHCVTRLRFKLQDISKANTDVLKKTNGVLQVIQSGGQYQVVVGTHVAEIYKELCEIGGFSAGDEAPAASSEEEKSGNLVSRFLITMTGIFNPLLSMLMASGMIKAVLVLLTVLGVLDKSSGTYTILYGMGDALFYFFPIVVGWSAAKKFGLKEIYGIVIGGVLTYPTLVALSGGEALYTVFTGTIFESQVYTTFLGIPVILPSAGYASSVIPAILIVFFASVLYKFFQTHLPAMLRNFFTPFLTLLITMPIGFLVIGPIAIILQGILTALISFVIGINTGLAGLLIGTFWTILVLFGLHMPVIMMFQLNIVTQGYDNINPLIFAGALANMGACLGVYLRTKDSSERQDILVPSFVSAFFGISEPALYGVLIPRRKLLATTLLSAGVGGMIAGFGGATLWNMSTSGPLGLPGFINPAGIDGGFISLCIGAVAAFVLATIAGFVFGGSKDETTLQLGEK